MAPNDPQGPNTPNPNLTDAVNRMGQGVTGLSEAEKLLGDINEQLRKAGERGDELTKRFKNVNMELTTAVSLAADTEEAVKEIASAAKTLRKGILDTKSAKDALATVTAIQKAQSILLDKTKQMPAAQARVKRQMQEMQTWMDKLKKTTGSLADDEMLKLQHALHEISKEGENVAKVFKGMSVSHLTRQITGITGALKTMGIGKGYAARVEKYQGVADAGVKIRDAQRARFEGNKEMFKEKREAALKAVQAKYGIDMANPRALRLAGKGTRKSAQGELASALGISTRGMSQADMIGLAGGKGTAASAAVEGRYHGTGATGMASRAATGVEGGLAGLAEMMGGFAPALAAVEGAVMLLVEAFDGYVAQNKAMESGLAKGGLFTTGAGGRGFTGARAGLTPDTAYTKLGLSFDRNLKIAQSIAEQGYAIQEIVSAGQAEEMTGSKGIGPAGEGFMAGGAGLVQRAVVGAGRIAGLTDAEGVQRVIKLMEEYRETLQQGENFFIQVSKGAKSAGLSTTKYISIIDEVMGRFDRMNRSLDATVSVMGELSKSGRLASEDLQQYFKFLTGGAGSQEAAGSSEQIFLLNRMSGTAKSNLASQQKQLMENLVDRAAGKGGRPGELAIPGISQAQIRKGFGGSAQEMDDFVTNVVQPAISTAQVDPTTKKSWNNLVEQMRSQKQQAETFDQFSKGKINAIGLGLGSKVGGVNMNMSMALQQGAMDFILRSGKLSEFKANPFEFAAKHKEVSFLSELFKNDPKALQNLPRVMEIAGQQRLESAQGGAKDQELFDMVVKDVRKKGLKINLQDPSQYKKYLMAHGNEMLNEIDQLHSTMGFWGKAAVKSSEEATDAERQAALGEAKKVGAQTQTMAEMIAHAFSKWFINIVSALEAIVDWLPGGDKNARAQRQADAQSFFGPKGTHAKETLEGINTLQESIDEQTDLADKANIAGDKKGEEQHKNSAKILQDQMDRIVAMQDAGSFFNQTDEESFKNFIQDNTGQVGANTRRRIAAEQVRAGMGGGNVDNSQTVIFNAGAGDRPPITPNTGSARNSSEKKQNSKPMPIAPVTSQ